MFSKQYEICERVSLNISLAFDVILKLLRVICHLFVRELHFDSRISSSFLLDSNFFLRFWIFDCVICVCMIFLHFSFHNRTLSNAHHLPELLQLYTLRPFVLWNVHRNTAKRNLIQRLCFYLHSVRSSWYEQCLP